MQSTTYTEDNWQVTVSQPVKAIRQNRRTGEDIPELVVNVDLVKWGETVILEDEQIAYDWQDKLTGQFAFIHWDGVVYDDRVVEEVRQELADEIRWALEDIVSQAVDWQVEYDTQHDDSLQDYCDCLTQELGYHLRGEKLEELIAHILQLEDRLSAVGFQSITREEAQAVIDKIDRWSFEGRFSSGYWAPSWSDCFILQGMQAGEAEIELETVFPGVSREELRSQLGSEHAYGCRDGAYHAVLTHETLASLLEDIREETCNV